MRIIALAVALIVAYIWRRRTRKTRGVRPTSISLLVLVLACALVLWAEQVVYDWTGFWRRDIFEWLPLGACAVGAALGYIFADQRLGENPEAPP